MVWLVALLLLNAACIATLPSPAIFYVVGARGPLNHIGSILYLACRYAGAVKAFRSAVSVDPRDVHSLTAMPGY